MAQKELTNPQYCINSTIRKAARAVGGLYTSEMHETDLQRTQFTLLSTISGYTDCTITQLAGYLVMDQTTVTRSVDKLRKGGYVEVVPGEDRRTRILRITELGRSEIQEAYPAWQRVQSRVWSELGPEKSKQLLQLLNEVIDIA